MKVAEAARRSGLPAKTLGYCEEIGLVATKRRDNGYRDYDDGDVGRLRFLRRARQMGFTISDCRQVFGYVVNSVADLPTNTLTDILLLKHMDLSFTQNSAFAVLLELSSSAAQTGWA